MRIFNILLPIFATAKHWNIVHWTRAVQRHKRDNVPKVGRLHRRERAPHAFGFQLEYAHGVATLQQFVHSRVIMRQQVEIDLYATLSEHLATFLQHRKGFKTQKVKLNKASAFDIFHVELSHRHV